MEFVISYLSGRTVVVHRIPACDDLHEKHPKAVHVASLVQQARVGVLRGYIPAQKATKKSMKTVENFHNHCVSYQNLQVQ